MTTRTSKAAHGGRRLLDEALRLVGPREVDDDVPGADPLRRGRPPAPRSSRRP
ncbi:hypothetical protein [Pseudonocardia sp. ICBG601]|uniref:hypothetical protein n=1 Tax=Pseudonocardia sp. ICBG601 TaxID=2846759 RepID=UPI001CF71270|nr:hypothetical protein [Pseudonocardia sp. ICBG601]